jgi:ABC-type antimicrobial peptide transport system permease subunit
VRAASDGVRIVYGIIGWGILLIVGLGILVAQLVVLRDRTWLLGLSRAVGARKADIATLVAVDVALMLTVGFASALILCAVSQPMVGTFGMQAFQVHLQLVRWADTPALLGAVLLTLAVGAGYPMLKAMRLDPVEVLERR